MADERTSPKQSSSPPRSPAPTASPERILSVDVLRGFDMFWIVGGEWLVIWILNLCSPRVREALMPQFFHVPWEGFHFMDLIFPLFVFLAGMSAVFSLDKIVAQRGTGKVYWRLLRRTAVIFLLGLICYGGLTAGWPKVRMLGVLQRIALCYFFAGLAVIHLRVRGTIVMLVALLGGYWALLCFVRLPGQETISFELGKNWANYVDLHYLIGRPVCETWDPEGLLSTLPAIGSCLLGVLAARLLKNTGLSDWAKVGCLIGGGILGVLLGYLWGRQFPIIKNIWTSSYVVLAGGYSCILLGLFYALIDVCKLRFWTAVFVWLGTNAITIYMLHNIFSFDDMARRMVSSHENIGRFLLGIPAAHRLALRLAGDESQAALLGESVGRVAIAAVSLALTLALARFLYRRKIFLRA
jgi:predicted acyltransferase